MKNDTALLIESVPERLDEADLDAMISALPLSWQARIRRYKPFAARLRSAIGYTLLARILQETYGMPSLPAVETDAHGKPHLIDTSLYFSISHCHTAVACIVKAYPVGLDVQDIFKAPSPSLAARIAAPLPSDGMDAVALTCLWTQKEASAKLDGRGLTIGLENLPLKEHILQTITSETYCLSIAR